MRRTAERHNVTIDDNTYRLVRVEYGLRKLVGQPPYFTVTGEAWHKGSRRRDPDVAGSIHEIIETAFSDLADLIALHLSDIDGVPMHAHENGWYWFSDYDGRDVNLYPHNEPMYSMTPTQRAEHYLRAPSGHFDGVVTRAGFDAQVDALREQWKREAGAAIEKHGLQSDE